MAFVIPDRLSDDERQSLVYTFFNSSGAIQPDFLSFWRGAYRPVLYVFGSIHLILSIWMVLEYFIINWPNFKLPSIYYSLITRYTHVHVYILSHDLFMYCCVYSCTKKEAPEETYSDVPVFGLQTIYVVVSRLMCSVHPDMWLPCVSRYFYFALFSPWSLMATSTASVCFT